MGTKTKQGALKYRDIQVNTLGKKVKLSKPYFMILQISRHQDLINLKIETNMHIIFRYRIWIGCKGAASQADWNPTGGNGLASLGR